MTKVIVMIMALMLIQPTISDPYIFPKSCPVTVHSLKRVLLSISQTWEDP